ncbi:MAG: hypothetical protein JNG90_14835 [Planctomycetaceae bacterium]|nr:hypothetical protein [Planctomycetaceae bacterium]
MSRIHFGLRYLLAFITLSALQMSAVRCFGPRALVLLPLVGALSLVLLGRGVSRPSTLVNAICAECGGAAGLVIADLLARYFWRGSGLSLPTDGWEILCAYVVFGGAAFTMFAVAAAVLAGSTAGMPDDERKVVFLAIGWTLIIVWMIGLTGFAVDPYMYVNEAPDDVINIAAWYFLSLFFGSIFATLPATIVVSVVLVVHWWRFKRKPEAATFDE